MRVGLIQMAPIWLDREQTTQKVLAYILQAGKQHCDLVAFGEALVPGYPFWVSPTGGAQFNDDLQKRMFALYAEQAVQIGRGDLAVICEALAEHQMAAYLGIIERAEDRGGHSLYCSLVYIDATGVIQSVHRKLMPTFEERLVWSPGDGHGLVTHQLNEFTVGGLNCWENWMPLARTSLYAQGENLHVAVWPGNHHNTHDLTPVMAKEGRSYVLSVSGMLRSSDVSQTLPIHAEMMDAIAVHGERILANGGSCLCAPNGRFLIEPQCDVEGVFVADVDLQEVYQARQNFDPVGHYSRPDVLQMTVNRQRQKTADFNDE